MIRPILNKVNTWNAWQLSLLLLLGYILILPLSYFVFSALVILPSEYFQSIQPSVGPKIQLWIILIFGYAYSMLLLLLSGKLFWISKRPFKFLLIPYLCFAIFIAVYLPGILVGFGYAIDAFISCKFYHHCIPPLR